jgi:hypothetical protein
MNLDPASAPSEIEQAIDLAWRRLPRDLTRKQLEGIFAPTLPSATVDAFLGSERLERRLADRVGQRLGLARPTVGDFDDPPTRIVLAGRDALELAIRLAGAIYHRKRINRLVLRSERADVSAGIGADAFAAALACGEDGRALTADWTTAELVEACRRDGPIALSSWRTVLPRGIGDWIAVLTPALAALDVPEYPERSAIEAAHLAASAALGTAHG